MTNLDKDAGIWRFIGFYVNFCMSLIVLISLFAYYPKTEGIPIEHLQYVMVFAASCGLLSLLWDFLYWAFGWGSVFHEDMGNFWEIVTSESYTPETNSIRVENS